LRARLADGRWPVGTRLPNEHDLAAELGVGRSTLREALHTLISAGVLSARRGVGTTVLATDELELALARRLDTVTAHRVLEVRGALEVEAARLAAIRATEEDLAVLRGLLAERDDARAARDDQRFVRADLDWHAAMAAAAHNELLLELYVNLDRASAYARTESSTLAVAWDAEAETLLHTLHSETFRAIEARDPEAAASAARRLIAGTHLVIDDTTDVSRGTPA